MTNYLKKLADMQTQIKELVPDEFEKWYQFCMKCPHSYKRKDDADTVYCGANKNHCPYRDEIEELERKEE